MLTAPVDGVVLARNGPPLATGDGVKSAEHLVSISKGNSLAVRGLVDEIRIGEIGLGDPVRISGAAFPDTTLDARIVQVSPYATKAGRSPLPSFMVVAAVEGLDENETQAVRLGMSAHMAIVVYERDDAVLVPIGAVDPRSRTVEIRDRGTGEVRTVRVRTGRTTSNGVEILEGLNAGDVVVLR